MGAIFSKKRKGIGKSHSFTISGKSSKKSSSKVSIKSTHSGLSHQSEPSTPVVVSKSFTKSDTYSQGSGSSSSRKHSSGENTNSGIVQRTDSAGHVAIAAKPSDSDLVVYKFKDIAKATQNFTEDWVLGEGGFGKVFRGRIRDPLTGELTNCAVKRLNEDSFQGQDEWLAEIIFLGKLRHPNLVRLFGYCSEAGEGILVYEFLPNGSLDYHIFGPFDDGFEPLPFRSRLFVVLQAAQGLLHLHENNIIHRDFKAPNVLLDEKNVVKLTDFGLAKASDPNQSHVSTRIMGTMGYLDPKYMENGHLTKKSDVYSFGVMLFEVLTGKRAMDEKNPKNPPVTRWAHTFLAQRKPDILTFLDVPLRDEVESMGAQRIVQKLAITAKHCTEKDPKFRPTSSDLVDTLMALLGAYDELAGE